MSKEEDRLYHSLREIFPLLNLMRNYRPNFLKNPQSNNNLEIDIYLKEFHIGFEYQGMVHFKNIDRYKNDSDKSRYNDTLKQEFISKTECKTIIEIFPSDLSGDIKKNIELRIYNTIYNNIKSKRRGQSIIRLLFLYYFLKYYNNEKICMRNNKLVYWNDTNTKLKMPYAEIQDVAKRKTIELLESKILKNTYCLKAVNQGGLNG